MTNGKLLGLPLRKALEKSFDDLETDIERAVENAKEYCSEESSNEAFSEHFGKKLLDKDRDKAREFLEHCIHLEKHNEKSFLLYFTTVPDEKKSRIINEIFGSKNKGGLIKKRWLVEVSRNAESVVTKARSINSPSPFSDIEWFKEIIERDSGGEIHDYLSPFIEKGFEESATSIMYPSIVDSHILTLSNNIKSSIRNTQPFSLVRLGDGEGCFIGDMRRESSDQDFMYNLWFGRVDFSHEERAFFAQILEESYNNASAIGIPNIIRLIDDYTPNFNNRNYRAISSIYNEVLQKKPVTTSAFVHFDLWTSGELRDIIKEAGNRITTISGHPEKELSKSLSKLGIDIDFHFEVPAENKFSKRFGKSNQSDHFDDTFPYIVDQLSALNLKGRLVLVGAGFLGKYYCEIVRKQGGVAIDIGSIFDYMLGHRTRRHVL